MTDCTLLSDRMIAVAHGRAAWAAGDEAHLAACQACAAEWTLVQRAARLGINVGAELPADFVATRVLAELRQPLPAGWHWGRAWRWLALPMAAAAALVVWRSQSSVPEESVGATVVASQGLLPELEFLDASELDSLLDVLSPTDAPVGDVRGLGDLDEDELQAMLRSMEG